MYCFSQICRICLGEYSTEFTNLHAFDYDKIRIHEKLKFCVPEIVSDDIQLPENVCTNCSQFVQQMYKFKQMCIENTNNLYTFIAKLSGGVHTDYIKSTLYVSMEKVKMESENENQVQLPNNAGQNSDGISMFSISLNQWDLFETKFTCRCIKDYNSFTEKTTHLCKNCEGELHGFRLSKIKVGIAENRYNNSLTNGPLDSDDNNSNFSQTDSETKGSKTYEKGFDYNDILLCQVHVSGVNKQINTLQNASYEIDENVAKVEEIDIVENEYISSNDEIVNLAKDENISEKQDNVSDDETELSLTENTKYQCPLCEKSYTRRYNLHHHYITHGDVKFYYCKQCRNKYTSEEELQNHVKVHVNKGYIIRYDLPNNPLKLPYSMNKKNSPKKQILNKSFNDFQTKMSEKQVMLSPKKHKLNNSLNDFRSKAHASTPKKQKPNINITDFQNSSSSDQISDEDSDTDDHNSLLLAPKPDLNSSEESLICGTCDKVFNHKSHLAIHLLTHFGKKEFKCSACGKEFFRRENFEEHKKIHKMDKKFQCNQCEKSYDYLSNLRRHQYCHGAKYLCSICNKQFADKSVLEEHIFSKHTKPVERFHCQNCTKSFDHIDHLKTHELVDHPKTSAHSKNPKNKEKSPAVKPVQYVCKTCYKSFSTADNLKRHELIHLNIRIKTVEGNGHYCPICDRTYSIKTNIKKHIKTHSNGKIRKCGFCLMKFTNVFLLRQHIKTHTEVLNFKCDLCDKAYLTKHTLIRHEETSHKQ